MIMISDYEHFGASFFTFLVAMMFVFFDNTSAATKISVGIVVAVLCVTMALLLYFDVDVASYVEVFTLPLVLFQMAFESCVAWLKPHKSEPEEERGQEERVEMEERATITTSNV